MYSYLRKAKKYLQRKIKKIMKDTKFKQFVGYLPYTLGLAFVILLYKIGEIFYMNSSWRK